MISVIVPTYNASSYLSQALTSLIKETKVDLEILAINDGSTDGSLAIMQDLASRDSRIRVIDKANEGYGAACNLGIREAKGDWIAILEPDDWIEPGMYSDMLDFAKREFGEPNKLDIIESPYWIIRNPDTPQEAKLHCAYRGRIKPPHQPFTIHDAPHLLAHHPSIWSAIYRRDFLIENNIWFREIPGAGWADNPFLVETLCQAKAIAYWPKEYYCYREETPEKAAALAKRNPLMPFERWNDMVDVLERLNVTDSAVWIPQITRGFTYMGIMIEHTGIEGHPEIEQAIHAMFDRMPADLVFANPRVTPAQKRLFAQYRGIKHPKNSHAAYVADLISEGVYNIWNKGPVQTLKMMTAHLSSYGARAGK